MLSAAQKRFFYEEGYIKIPGAVPQIMVEAARHAMNHSIGSAGKQGEESLVAHDAAKLGAAGVRHNQRCCFPLPLWA